MKNLDVGSPSFEYLIKESYLYVDKTEYIYKMVHKESGSDFYFITRPRRFGKSLMCSTLHELFKGKKELFKDLYIDGTDYDFKEYPVLRFDFSDLKKLNEEDFIERFCNSICEIASEYGVNLEMDDPDSMLAVLLSQIEEPVILIDEFDAPIINSISDGDKELAEVMRRTFNDFYSTIKKYSGKVRFLFITGCTKLSGLNIFS